MVESVEASCLEGDLEEWAEGYRLVETCSSGLETGSVLMRKIPLPATPPPSLPPSLRFKTPCFKMLWCHALPPMLIISCFSCVAVDVETRTLLGGWSVTSVRHPNPKVSVPLLSLQVTASLEFLFKG